jgi:membrane-associated phospholipid phosphatase
MATDVLPKTEPRSTSFFHRPSLVVVGRAIFLGLLVTVWWVLIYHGTNYVTPLLPYRVRLHLDAELDIPFVPASVLGYMSIYPLFWMAPFVLRTREELDRLALGLAVITLVAGICFVLFPAESHFRTPADWGEWGELIHFARWLALKYNFAPSLHVGLAVTCITVYARRAPAWGKVILWTWSGLVALSTLFLHQHYVIDVITGYLLGWGGAALVCPLKKPHLT